MVDNSRVNKQFDQLENRIQMAIDQRFTQKVNTTMKRIEKQMMLLQQQFFTMLVMKTVGVKGAPKLGSFTPTWKPLNDAYTENREFNMDVPDDQFFVYSGKLGATLSRMKATTFFGKPLVVYDRGKFKQKTMSTYSKTDPSKVGEKLKARITVDLFPRVIGSINDIDESDLFGKVRITEKRGKKSTTTPLSYRLKNFQGRRDRPVVVEFMNWWLNTKARKLVREAGRI